MTGSPRLRDLAMVGVALVLAFVVGVLFGQRCDRDAASPCEPVDAIVQVEERVVYRCPPDEVDAGAAEVAEVAEVASPTEPKPARSAALPSAPPPVTPRARQQLLAWVRDQSTTLDACRTAAKETYRLTVTLQVAEEGAVHRVAFNADELPAGVATCLRDRMLAWTPPKDLLRDGRPLVFGLTL